MQCDVLIIGGSVVGSSAAWHLREDGFRGRIVVLERDLTYARASAFLAMGGIRQQFCTPVTVQMVRYSIEQWKTFDDRFATPAHQPRARFRQRGYLFLADDSTADALRRRYEAQMAAGAHVQLLTPDELRMALPDAYLDDIRFGMFGPHDGYAAPREVLHGLRHAAAGREVEYLERDVTQVLSDAGRACGVRLSDGEVIEAPIIVNAAGAWSGALARSAGLDVPVVPVRQMLFRATLPQTWPYRMPMIIDPGGVHWRHDDALTPDGADRLIVARTRWEEPAGEHFEPVMSRWEEEFLPALVRRVPAFRDLTDVEGWAGLYEMTPDHNPVLGEHPAVRGVIFASGFSGHGLMMSPATGKIVSELVRYGESRTFDIGIFAPDRFERGALVHDAATI